MLSLNMTDFIFVLVQKINIRTVTKITETTKLNGPYIIPSEVRFLDTMSLHICVSGLESSQRGVWLQRNKGERAGEESLDEKWPGKWMQVGSPNSLAVSVNMLYPTLVLS